jgi:hypothetical protein
MQKAPSLPVRLIALVSVCVGCPPLVGCGGGSDTVQGYNTELDLLDRQKKENEEASSNLLDSYSAAELLQPAVEGARKRIINASELSAILDDPTSATIGAK